MSNYKIHYYGMCEHIQNYHVSEDMCLKRYIDFFNFRTGDYETLAICNDFLKIKHHQNKIIGDKTNVVFKCLLDFLKIDTEYNFSNAKFNFKQPKIFSKLVVELELTKYYNDLNFVVTFEIKDFINFYLKYPSQYLLECLCETLNKYILDLSSKTSLNRNKNLILLVKKLKDSYRITNDFEVKIIIINEIVLEIFKECIKEQKIK